MTQGAPAGRELVLSLLCHVDGEQAADLLGAPQRVTLRNAEMHAPSDAVALERLIAVVDYVRLVVGTSGPAGLRSLMNDPAEPEALARGDLLRRGSADDIRALRTEFLQQLTD